MVHRIKRRKRGRGKEGAGRRGELCEKGKRVRCGILRGLAGTMAGMSIMSGFNVSADSLKGDRMLARQYIENRYPKEYKVCFISAKKLTPEMLRQRKRKHIIYVAKWNTVSRGVYGETKKGNIIRYGRKVKKGKKVKSYLIYNPDTRYLDDIVAVVDNGIIR